MTKPSFTVRHPDISVKLSGHDGNAFAILGKVSHALKAANVPECEVAEFMKEAQSGDYNKLLQVCMQWVEVE
jgi:hypothetical protein